MNKLRYKYFWIDFQGDGRFPKERIKGKDKRLLRKWTARKKYKEWLKGEEVNVCGLVEKNMKN